MAFEETSVEEGVPDRTTTSGGGSKAAGRGPNALNWVFTLNNYSDSDVRSLRELGISSDIKCLGFQSETGANGTKHLQGYVCLSKRSYLSGLRRIFGRVDSSTRYHFECMRGTPEQAKAYCSKEETANGEYPYEQAGDLPAGTGSRTDLAAVAIAIRAGVNDAQLLDQFPDQFLKYSSGIKRARFAIQTPRHHKTIIVWCYGPTGSGKSRFVSDTLQGRDAFYKMPGNTWWDGYECQPYVVIDDYRPDLCKFSYLLQLFDRYPFSIEIKGGTCQFVARTIFVTAPKRPEELWHNRTEEDLQQLQRRIEFVREFCKADGFVLEGMRHPLTPDELLTILPV